MMTWNEALRRMAGVLAIAAASDAVLIAAWQLMKRFRAVPVPHADMIAVGLLTASSVANVLIFALTTPIGLRQTLLRSSRMLPSTVGAFGAGLLSAWLGLSIAINFGWAQIAGISPNPWSSVAVVAFAFDAVGKCVVSFGSILPRLRSGFSRKTADALLIAIYTLGVSVNIFFQVGTAGVIGGLILTPSIVCIGLAAMYRYKSVWAAILVWVGAAVVIGIFISDLPFGISSPIVLLLTGSGMASVVTSSLTYMATAGYLCMSGRRRTALQTTTEADLEADQGIWPPAPREH